MVFRHFKKLIAVLKTKASAKSQSQRNSTRNHAFTNIAHLKRIMVFGDSNSFRPDDNRTCWPTLLEKKDSLHLRVFNESCEGRTTKYDNGKRNGLNAISSKIANHLPLDYVVVMLGTNDMKNKYGPPSPQEITEGMSQILDLIDAHGGGAKPILLTPPPIGNVSSGELEGGQSRIPSVATEYRLLAMNRGFSVVDLHLFIDITTDIEVDMIHLNASGRQKVANAVWAYLQDAISLPVTSQ